MLTSIACATDFSKPGLIAFSHALSLALHHKCRLDILHVHQAGEADHWERFPNVREVLEGWGYLAAGARPDEIFAHTGVEVRKVEICAGDVVSGLGDYLDRNLCQLLMMSSRGHAGLFGFLLGAIALEAVRSTRIPAIVFGPLARPFVDAQSGELLLRRILMPIAPRIDPSHATAFVDQLTSSISSTQLGLVHVGTDLSAFEAVSPPLAPIRLVSGGVESAICHEAEAVGAQLITIPTSGRKGLLDALKGSTVEQVIARAQTPVLAIPS